VAFPFSRLIYIVLLGAASFTYALGIHFGPLQDDFSRSEGSTPRAAIQRPHKSYQFHIAPVLQGSGKGAVLGRRGVTCLLPVRLVGFHLYKPDRRSSPRTAGTGSSTPAGNRRRNLKGRTKPLKTLGSHKMSKSRKVFHGVTNLELLSLVWSTPIKRTSSSGRKRCEPLH